jgi:hypothetical protein
VNKKQLNALERVYEAEIENRLPYQSKAKVFKELAVDGYLQEMTTVFGGNSVFAVTVTGWQLTHLGRLAFCMGVAA